MPTPYEKIYSFVLPKFHSYNIAKMDENELKDYLHDFLVIAVSHFYICRKDLTDRDEENQCFNVDLSDIEIEIVSNYLLIEYLDSTYIRTSTLLKVALGSSDFNTYSPANMLDKLIQMKEHFMSENEALLSRYSWIPMKNDEALLSGNKFNNSNYKLNDSE